MAEKKALEGAVTAQKGESLINNDATDMYAFSALTAANAA